MSSALSENKLPVRKKLSKAIVSLAILDEKVISASVSGDQ